MQWVYCNLNKGTLVRTNTGKRILAEDGLYEVIKIPKWTNSSNLHSVNSLNELDELENPVAVHTGRSGIIVLDFDTNLFDTALLINNSLNKKEQCTSIAKSIDKEGGHFIYKYTDNDLTAYIDNPNGRKYAGLDILYGNSLVFIANNRNKTKEIICGSDNLVEVPLAIQHLVISHYARQEKDIKSGKEVTYHTGSKLAHLAMQIEDNEVALHKFLNIVVQPRHKILMAKSNKELPDLHPDRIPDGEGYNFLQTISGVLMLDVSISKELHKDILFFLNSLFSDPLEGRRVLALWESDVVKPEYMYNPSWNASTFSRVNTSNDSLEWYASLEDGQYCFYKINNTTGNITRLKNKAAVLDDIPIETTEVLTSKDFISKCNSLKGTYYTPLLPYGIQDGYLNLYKQNQEQITFYNPHRYVDTWMEYEKTLEYNDKHPRYPKVTLGALKNAIGEHNLERFLAFMRRKFMTREHSPLFFVFYGVPHSFKTGVVNGVFSKLAMDRYLSISSKVLLDKYSGWMKDIDLVMLDEVHHLSRPQLEEIIGVINTITGTPILSGLRQMYKESTTETANNTLTFVICTNQLVTLTSEVQDRRMVLFKSKTKVSDALGMSDEAIMQSIKDETINFAYYLSTQISDLDDIAYKRNDLWKHIEYEEYTNDTLRVEDKLLSAIDKNDIYTFINTCIELGISPLEFNKCVEFMYKGNHLNIRLANSSPQNSVDSKPGLFDFTDAYQGFNKSMFLKRASTLQNVSRYVNDIGPTGLVANRKCIWRVGIVDKGEVAREDFVGNLLAGKIKLNIS